MKTQVRTTSSSSGSDGASSCLLKADLSLDSESGHGTPWRVKGERAKPCDHPAGVALCLWGQLQGAVWQVVMINLLIRGSVQTDRPVGFKLGPNQITRVPACLAEVLRYQTAGSLRFCWGGCSRGSADHFSILLMIPGSPTWITCLCFGVMMKSCDV